MKTILACTFASWFLLGAGPTSAQQPERRAGTEPTERDEGQLIEDLKAAKVALKEHQEIQRIYGNNENEEAKRTQTKFRLAVRKVAPAFPLLHPRQPPATNGFFRLILNQRGAGFDGFRIRNTSSEPKNFGWIYALSADSSMANWYIIPAEEAPMKGFTDFWPPKVNYTNAPWSAMRKDLNITLQWLRGGEILPGKEYIIWFSFRDDKPSPCHLAFDFFPATTERLSRSVLEAAFGLKGDPIPGAY